jgi:hypothetical protein
VFLQLHWIGQYATKRANPHLEKPNWQEYSFENLTEFSQGKNVLDATAFKIDGFFGEINMFSYSPEWAYLEESNHI